MDILHARYAWKCIKFKDAHTLEQILNWHQLKYANKLINTVTHTCMHTHTHTHTHIYVHIYTNIYLFVYVLNQF